MVGTRKGGFRHGSSGLQEGAPSALPDLKYKAPLYVVPPAVKTPSGIPNVDFYEMTMRESAINVLNVPGGQKRDYPLTRIWGYNGETPGPQIHVEQGVRTIVRHVNGLAGRYGAPLASPKAGATEIWEIQNPSGGWFHPFHIHLVDFKVLSRNGKPAYAWEQGPKDVVYVARTRRCASRWPDNAAARECYDEEAARLANGWTGQRTGRYMMHCHNLVHEDHDMMGQFWVGGPPESATPSGSTTPDADPHHPINAAAAQPWDEDAQATYAGRPDLDHFHGF